MEEESRAGVTLQPRPKDRESEVTLVERIGILAQYVHHLPEDQRAGFLEHIGEAEYQASLTSFDELTGLRTNAWINRFLRHRLSRGRIPGVGLLFTDIDGFKQFNADHGRDGGNLALSVAGTLMHSQARQDDEMGRLSEGADEFIAVLLSVNSFENFGKAAVRIHKALNDPLKQKDAGYDLPVPLSISVGCVWVDWEPQANRRHSGDKMAAAMLSNADQLMYSCKRSGRVSFRHFTFSSGEISLHSEGELPNQ